MTTVRRVYLYLVSFLSLVMLANGLAGLGRALVQAATGVGARTVTSGLRGEVALNGALVLVGLPVWLLHWSLAQRQATRDPSERSAALRRLYVYALLAFMAIVATVSGQNVLNALFLRLLPGRGAPTLEAILQPVPWLVVSLAWWAYHRGVAIGDRLVAGEAGATATLRRWYTYGLALLALLFLLGRASTLLRLIWETGTGLATEGGTANLGRAIASPAASTLVVLAAWLVHWRLWAVGGQRQVADAGEAVALPDARSMLRPVYLFLALAVSVATTLYAAWQLLYFVLGRAFGVAHPGGVAGNLAVALAGPLSLLAVYGASWAYHRHALELQVAAQPELPRQAGVRRLYTYLVALIALHVLAAGAGGLLWTLADIVTNAPYTVNSTTWWREQISLFTSLVVIGLPVWLAYWGPLARLAVGAGDVPAGRPRRWWRASFTPAGAAAETRALARRLYVYLALLTGVLALLGSAAVAVWQLLGLLLGVMATPAIVTTLARSFAVASVAGLVVYYHQRVLRADVATASVTDQPEVAAAPAEAREGLIGEDVAAPHTRPTAQICFGVVFQLGGALHSEWYATELAARAALNRIRTAGPDWAAMVQTTESAGP